MTNGSFKETHLKVFKYARELIVNGWTRGAYARDNLNNTVSIFDDKACKFCFSGAIMSAILKVSGRTNNMDYPEFQYCNVISHLKFPDSAGLVGFNDTQENSEPILQLLDETIKRLENEV